MNSFKNKLPSDGLLLLRKGPAASLLFESEKQEKKMTIKAGKPFLGRMLSNHRETKSDYKIKNKKNGRMT